MRWSRADKTGGGLASCVVAERGGAGSCQAGAQQQEEQGRGAAARGEATTSAGHDPLLRGWRLTLGENTVRARILVNAAGAWADKVAAMAGVPPIGIAPLRRTMVQLRTAPAAPLDLPLTLGVMGDFYFKPEAGRVWLSPHDETLVEPGDAAPDELDVAIAIDRFQHVVDWQIEAVEHRWAGLRSFAPDRLPVIGFDRSVPGFFWFAGQGGFGIQTAPAAAALAATILLGLTPPAMLAAVDATLYDPARFG